MHTPRKDPFSFNPEAILAADAVKKVEGDQQEPNVFDYIPVLLAPRQVRLLVAQVKARHPWVFDGNDDPKFAVRAQSAVFSEIGVFLRGFKVTRDKNLIGFLTVALVSSPHWKRAMLKKKTN